MIILDIKNVNIDENITCDEFQSLVKDVLIRHSSILDITTKLTEYTARINRAVMKSVTTCGCVEIEGQRQDFNKETLAELKESMTSQVTGNICPICKDILEDEIGSYIFYLGALCNALNIDMKDPIIKEYKNMNTLGIFNLK